MSELISIIVPVYNVQDYLEDCIESIIHQTYTNLEIILVDDGSPDDCPAICDRYAAQDSRIIVIHKENGGQSEARNAALDIATGDYILFVDSDDWLDADACSILCKAINESHPQIICFSFCHVYRGKVEIHSNERRTDVISGKEAFERLLLGRDVNGYACSKLYHRTLFENVRFPVGEIYEDIAITPDLLLACECVSIISMPLYFYRHREGSSLNSPFNEGRLAILDRAKKCIAMAEKENPAMADAAYHFYAMSIIGVMSGIDRSPKNVRKKFRTEKARCIREMKTYYRYISNPKQRIKYWLLVFGLYRYTVAVYHRLDGKTK